MKLERILIAAAAIAAVVFLTSFFKGDASYLRELTARTMTRGMLEDASSALEKDGGSGVSLKVEGASLLRAAIEDEIVKYDGFKPDEKSPYTLLVSMDDAEKGISGSVTINKGGSEIFSRSLKRTIGDWTSLLPPLVAIILAIVLRRVFLSLSIAIWLGAMLSYSWNPLKSAYYGATHYLLGNLMGEFSFLIMGFVFVLVGMVNIINRGGGMAGVINQITKIARTGRTACVSAAALGVLIFFDDYMSSIVVGSTMRSFTDKMRVSREKLSYIVDATSAPITGVALFSTWIGFEVVQLHRVANFVGVDASGYSLFLQALPFRFYCIFSLVFVFAMCLLRRDFGPMYKAERRAAEKGQVYDPDDDDVGDSVMLKAIEVKKCAPERWYNAAIPVFVVFATLVVSIILRAKYLIASSGGVFSLSRFADLRECFVAIGGDGDTLFKIMLGAAVLGSLAAAALMIGQRILTMKDVAKAWLGGWKILPAAAILVFAWSIQQVCEDLGTALFLSALVKDIFSPVLLPLIIFFISAAVSFATGTSFGTMGLMLPTIAPLAFTLGNPVIFVMSLGAVLDGAIFGDHCSPISDTTIISALSSSCDLVDHVKTQLPYAVLCMLVAATIGYLPAAMSFSTPYLYVIGAASLVSVLLLLGRNPEKGATAIANGEESNETARTAAI